MAAIRIFCLSLALLLINTSFGFAESRQFKIAIMQDEKDAAQKYRPLVTYLKKKAVNVVFVETPTYPVAANMFASGDVDAMFSGSGIAGTMIIKDLTTPLLRPLTKDGFSTYKAVLLAPKGSPKYNGSADYFNGKKVIFCALASSGEIYYHSLQNIASAKATTQIVPSHGAAIDALARGFADIAIVKNRVWDRVKTKYPNLIVVGEDNGENPDTTLIVSRKANPQTVAKVADALFSLKDDKSPLGQEVRDQLNIQGYIKTTKNDFKHTIKLLGKAGVDKSFNFTFNDFVKK